jgi:hypothetical protein
MQFNESLGRLKRVCGPRKEKDIEQRELHDKVLHSLYCLYHIIIVIK